MSELSDRCYHGSSRLIPPNASAIMAGTMSEPLLKQDPRLEIERHFFHANKVAIFNDGCQEVSNMSPETILTDKLEQHHSGEANKV